METKKAHTRQAPPSLPRQRYYFAGVTGASSPDASGKSYQVIFASLVITLTMTSGIDLPWFKFNEELFTWHAEYIVDHDALS